MNGQTREKIWLTTEGLGVGYQKTIVSGLDVELRSGEMVCLIGPNGAGKTTLVRTLAGMLKPLEGRVLLDGEDTSGIKAMELARRLAVVLTERVEIGNLSAYSLAALGRYPYTGWHGQLTGDDQKAVAKAMEQAGCLELADRAVRELSDGERQKVMIARALAQEPRVLLLDEPTAFLDLPRRVELLRLLRGLARETESAILMTTHDLDLALRVADRLWLISSNGEFREGIPEELALNGSIEEAFRSEGVRFDHERGAFQVNLPTGGKISLSGEDGVSVAWTWRALERIGFEVRDVDPQAKIAVRAMAGRRWKVQANEWRGEFNSLAELLIWLEDAREAV